MPELPEVEIVARQLAPPLEGNRVRSLRIYDPRLQQGPLPRIAGRTIRTVRRSGKRVLVEFSGSSSDEAQVWLAVHLRMTGRLIFTERSGDPRDHLRAKFTLDHGALVFCDTRRFGTFDWYPRSIDAQPAGLDPLSPKLTNRRLAELVGESRQNIKSWLLRQDRLVGLGNIYASEILHAAKVSPHREAGSLDLDECSRVRTATRRILNKAIDACGTTFSDFQDARGVEGSYQRFLRVYGREGEPCRRCDGVILREVQQQRSTFYCGACQV